MNKLYVPLIMLSVFALFFACSSKDIGEREARHMLENAVFSPEQAYEKYRTFYMKTERIIDESSASSMYLNALNREAYASNALFKKKVIQELYVQDNKLRLSCYIENSASPLELHIIYDGETLWSVSNFAQKDGQKVTFEQAKDYISFPKSDFFRRIRAGFEESGKEIEYKYAGAQKYNGYKCHIVEMGLKGDSENKAVFFIDKKSNIVVKTGWAGVFPNNSEVRKISSAYGEKIPSVVEMSYGQYFTAIIKYSVKVDEYIHPNTFNETNILLPMRGIYKDAKLSGEKADKRRTRIRTVLDSVQSFDFVLDNIYLNDYRSGNSNLFGEEADEIVIPELSKKLIPENAAHYRIPIASNEQAEVEAKEAKQPAAKPKAHAKKAPAAVKKETPAAVQNNNDETDSLEYSPRDAYKSIEAELEDMKENDPAEYIKMKQIIEEMKMKDENIKHIAK